MKNDGTPPLGFGWYRTIELAGWVLLIGWQFWLALGLFGPDPWQNLLSDEPISSGSHPQHLYLGTLGAKALHLYGTTSVVDPHFQVGYPKTPIFDGGRSAELFLFLGGGEYRPSAQKIGVLFQCLFVPFWILVAGRAVGLRFPTCALAAVLGMLIWWGPIGRDALEAGDTEILLAALSGLGHVGCLVAYHRSASWVAWLGAAASATVTWFLQPLLFPIALPILLLFYLSTGAKHPFFPWHYGFLAIESLAVVINLPWLSDWINYWWLRVSLPNPAAVLVRPNLLSVLTSSLWGGTIERNLAVGLVLSVIPGLFLLNQTRHRVAARLLGVGGTGAFLLSVLGIPWEPLGLIGTAALLGPSLWFGCLPAAYTWTWLAEVLYHRGRWGVVLYIFIATSVVLIGFMVADRPTQFLRRCIQTTPLPIGLGPDRMEIVNKLRECTTPDARILWEDRIRPRVASRWPALLPFLTDRSFVGGLDPDGIIEHSSIALLNQTLEGEPIELAKAEDLDSYCQRYNIGWVVAWSDPVKNHFLKNWPNAEKIQTIRDDGEGILFRVKREGFRYALKGHADLVRANCHQIVLGNVEPDADGIVLLSLHYVAGMRATPSRVTVSRSPSGEDPIGFVRLTLNGKAALVTLTWSR